MNPSLRIDAEFFNRQSLEAIEQIRDRAHTRLGDLCARIQHPIEVKRSYEDEGLLTVMAKNVRANRADMSDSRYMPESLRPVVARNKLNLGDVLVTRTGANFGQVAPWLSNDEAFACADILVLREPSLPTGYLSSFLESAKGKPLVLRGGYGAAQPHIAPPYLSDMLIPRFGEIEAKIARLVDLSVQQEHSAFETIKRAEETLLEALGLADWMPPEPVAYQQTLSTLQLSKRMDAEHFDPRHLYAEEVIARRSFELLDDLTEFVSSGPAWPSSSFTTPDDPDGTPFVRIRNCKPGQIEVEQLDRLLPAGIAKFKSGMARAGDIAVGMDGIKWFYAGVLEGGAYINQRVGWVRLSEDAPSSGYVQLVLNSPLGQAQLLRRMTIAQTVGHITLDDIRSIKIPIFDDVEMANISGAVEDAAKAKARAALLLEAAKRAVEIAIEDGEDAAMAFLDEAEGAD